MSEATNKLTEAKDYIESAQDCITDVSQFLSKLDEQIAVAISAKEKAEAELEAIRNDASRERQQLKANIDAINDRKNILLKEEDELKKRMAKLRTEEVQLNEKIANFKVYEARAMQVLQSKEKSLIEREKVLREKESLSPLLPRR